MLVTLLGVASACTQNGSPGATTKTTVDTSQSMGGLSAADQATLCANLSTTLTADFGTRDMACKFSSSGGPASSCESRYATCEQNTAAQVAVSACTANNTDMFQCPITVAAYIACFDATNAQIVDMLDSGDACHLTNSSPAQPPRVHKRAVRLRLV